jgi:thiamine-phosphate pyrophosphorylase
MKASLPRFYPILDTGKVELAGLTIIEAAKAVLDAGAGILQLRHKEHFDRRMFEISGQVAALCRKAGALFVINDRADMAVLLDAALHVGQDDLPAIESRALIGSGRLLGVSTHNEAQLLASNADPVDYVAIGPIFETGSKRNPDPVLGVGELSRLRRLTRRPVVAIGGIKRDNCMRVLQSGADSVAVIGDLFPPGCSPIGLQQRVEEWMRATNG